MSTLAQKFSREMYIDQYLNIDGVLFFWNSAKNVFVEKETGKVLSSNDFTDDLKAKLVRLPEGGTSGGTADAVAWENITGKPTDLIQKPAMDAAISSATAGLASKVDVNNELDAMDDRIDEVVTSLNDKPNISQVNQAINERVSGVYRFAGSVPSYSNLPTSGMVGGDVYNVEDTDMNYGWVEPKNGQPGYWDPLGTTFRIEPIPNSILQQIVEGTYGS